MSVGEMVSCVTVGISAGMVFKLMIEILFYTVRKIIGWISNP